MTSTEKPLTWREIARGEGNVLAMGEIDEGSFPTRVEYNGRVYAPDPGTDYWYPES